MKVKITKASANSHWYTDMIGEIFEITSYNEFFYKTNEKIAAYDKRRLIAKSDCEIVNDNTEV